tara:strand:- start:10 stop:789 length:780 start_codon:yes stop_codon:yes gene_type:complete
MAETLTMEPNVEKTSIDNLSAEEQDSLKVGEQMQEAQDNLLAGKYKNAEELEKGYLELQQKLNSKEEPAQEEQEEQAEEEAEVQTTILDQLWDEATSEKGEFTQETLDELGKMNVEELAQMHLEYRNSVQGQQPEGKDFSEADIKELKGIVGGEQNYSNMIDWAQKSLNEQEVKMFDAVMERGDPLAAFFAVRSLAYAYNDAIGYDGNMVQGKEPRQSNDQFRSQQEVVRAMADPRYDEDPAYRRDIMEKLERSPNVQF